MSVLSLRKVTAGYGGVPAIHDVDLEVRAGELVALLGANGAGKTTTVRAVCGLAAVSSGTVCVLGADVAGMKPRTRARLGLATVPDDRGVFTQLTVAENLRVGTRGRGSHKVLESWFPQLDALLGRRAGLLSGGEQTLLALARALAGRPRAIVLDELTTGLAPVLADAAFGVLRRAAQEWGTGVLLAEQSVQLALEVSDRAYLLRRGRAVLEGPATEVAREPGALESGYVGDMG